MTLEQRFNPNRLRIRQWGLGIIPLMLAIVLWAQPPLSHAQGLPAPEISSNTEVATGGYYRVSWKLPTQTGSAVPQFELQESSEQTFSGARRLYQGPDLARVISGQRDGTRYYRVRASVDGRNTPWSAPVSVAVAHHPLSRALSFFAAGAVVFGATVTVIIKGARKAQRDA